MHSLPGVCVLHEFTTAVVIGRNVEVAGMLRPFKNRTSVHRPATLRLHQLACTSMPPRKVSPSVSLLYPPTFCRPAPLRCFHLCLDSSPAPPSRCCSGQTAWTRTGALLPIAGQCDVERCVHRPGEAAPLQGRSPVGGQQQRRQGSVRHVAHPRTAEGGFSR